MSIGDHIQFVSTGVRGLVVKFTQHGSIEFAHVLCGPDADGDFGGEILAFPRAVIESSARIL
jgi:hypothetical protein